MTDDNGSKPTAVPIAVETVPTDISARAHSVARLIDRLGPGEYFLTIERPTDRVSEWTITISAVQKVKTFRT